jgi:hypothetical protein
MVYISMNSPTYIAFASINRLLNIDLTSDMGARSSSESSMVSSTFGESNTADFNEDTEYLIRNEQKPAVRYTTRQMLTFFPLIPRIRERIYVFNAPQLISN